MNIQFKEFIDFLQPVADQLKEFNVFHIKHNLKIKYYIRYADDFVIFSRDKKYLQYLLPGIKDFLDKKLKLQVHPNKIFLKTLSSGMDFLGWVNFTDHRVLRNKTKRRMFIRIKENSSDEAVNSYLGLLKHGNTKIIRDKILNIL